MLYKDRLMDVVTHYLAKTYTYTEIKKMMTVYGPVSKKEVEATVDGVMFAIKKLIDEDARKRLAADVEAAKAKENE